MSAAESATYLSLLKQNSYFQKTIEDKALQLRKQNKIIEIFYPGIEVGANTIVSGNINSDQDEFKLKFDSPKISAFENYFDKVKIDIDNKKPAQGGFFIGA